jgi:ABC-type multidrug transport system fused ATPase/permease subunit
MRALLGKIASVRWFVRTLYVAFFQVPTAPERLLTRSKRLYTAQCVALMLVASLGSWLLIDSSVRESRSEIVSALRHAELELSQLVRLQKNDDNRRFVEANVAKFEQIESAFAEIPGQLFGTLTFSRLVAPVVYPLIVGLCSLIFAFSAAGRLEWRKICTLFHFTFLSFITLFTLIFAPILMIHTQFSLIRELTYPHDVNLECWLYVSDSNAPNIMVELAKVIAAKARPYYRLEGIANQLLPWVAIILVAGIFWSVVRIRLLTGLSTRRVLFGALMAAIAYSLLNTGYAAVAPHYTLFQAPHEPCIDGKHGP